MEARKQITDQIQERFKELKEETLLLHSKWRWQHCRSAMSLLKLIYNRIWILITKLTSGCIYFIQYKRRVQLLIHFETVLFANWAWSNSINTVNLNNVSVKIYSFPQSYDKACHYSCMLEYYLRVILGLVYMEVGDPRCVREPAKVG